MGCPRRKRALYDIESCETFYFITIFTNTVIRLKNKVTFSLND